MADYDKKHGKKVMNLLSPAVRTADASSAAIDTLGYRAVTVCSNVGIGGITFDASNKIELLLLDSDDGSTFAAVDAEDVIMPYGETLGDGGIIRSFTAAKAAVDSEVHAVGYIGKKRYIKVTADFTGTHGTGTAIAMHVDLEKPDNLPVGQTSFVPSYPDRTAQ